MYLRRWQHVQLEEVELDVAVAWQAFRGGGGQLSMAWVICSFGRCLGRRNLTASLQVGVGYIGMYVLGGDLVPLCGTWAPPASGACPHLQPSMAPLYLLGVLLNMCHSIHVAPASASACLLGSLYVCSLMAWACIALAAWHVLLFLEAACSPTLCSLHGMEHVSVCEHGTLPPWEVAYGRHVMLGGNVATRYVWGGKYGKGDILGAAALGEEGGSQCICQAAIYQQQGEVSSGEEEEEEE